MTDTTELLDQLEIALQASFQDLLEAQAGDAADPPDKFARNSASLMKTLEELDARRARLAAKEASRHHTRYEDMPPPTPEDEARFYERFCKLVGLVDSISEDEVAMALARSLGSRAPS